MEEKIQKKDRIIKSKVKNKHKTLEKRIKMYENLPNNGKGKVVSYDWGKDLGKEILD